MPSTKRMTTKAGKVFYLIRASRGRGAAPLSTRWYPDESWSPRYTERELKKYAAEFERQVKAGEIVSRTEQKEREIKEKQNAAKIMTLRQYGETVFMPTKSVIISENTRHSYQSQLDRWIYPALGDLKMPDITPANISALLLSIQKQGRSYGTCKLICAVLSSLFKMAYMSDVVDRNPMDKVSRPKHRKGEVKVTEPESYTAEEVQRILASLEHEPVQWQAVIRLIIDTGIRRGECLGLQWKDVDFKANTITVSGNLCYTPKAGFYLDTPKNGQIRTIDVDPDVMALLQTLRADQAGGTISSYVFTRKGSAMPVDPQRLNYYMRHFGNKHGIAHFHPHKLRHSFASVAITNGADIASVSETLGHRDKAVTLNMYTHADQESRKRASQLRRDAVNKKAGQG